MYDRAEQIIRQAREQGYRSIAVICRDQREAEWTSKWLEDVTVLPVKLTKGLEFDVVILWNLRPETLSGQREEVQSRQEESCLGVRKQLYVAATRALHELYVLSGK